jgi:hypothetical protein
VARILKNKKKEKKRKKKKETVPKTWEINSSKTGTREIF